jgi:hypothetical protein
MRLKSSKHHSDRFVQALVKQVAHDDFSAETSFEVDHNLLSFYFHGLAAMESTVFGLAMMVALIKPADFPLVSKKSDRFPDSPSVRDLKVDRVWDQLDQTRPNDTLTKTLKTICRSKTFRQLKDVRNVCGHLGVPSAHRYKVDPDVFESLKQNQPSDRPNKQNARLAKQLRSQNGQVLLKIDDFDLDLTANPTVNMLSWLHEKIESLLLAGEELLPTVKADIV